MERDRNRVDECRNQEVREHRLGMVAKRLFPSNPYCDSLLTAKQSKDHRSLHSQVCTGDIAVP